ncbi:MAG: T9SS type A sorting domain-containing protein, partial [Bacteroidota bacterium]
GVGLNNRIQDVLLDVSQKVIAEEAGEVIFDSDLFAFQVGGMEVKEGGVIRDDRGLSVTATGPVIIDGTLLVDEAMYTFEDLVSVRDSGNLVPNRATAVVRFLGGLRNNGNLQLANNDVFGAGIFDGDIPIVVGDLLIRDGDSLIIENTAGLFISDSLEGEGPDAVLVNRSRIEFGSGIQTYVPMDQGELDLSFAGNTVAYVSTRANQVIRRAEYMNLEVSENTKVLSDGNISLRGNLILGADINKNPDLFDAGPIRFIGEQAQQIMGEGIVPSIEVDKTGGSLQVVDDIVIRESFIMTNGITNANPGVIGLLGGATLVETEASYVAGTVASQRNIDAGGANSFGGIGIKIRAAGSQPMGITTVLRHTDMPVLPGHIERYFEIQPTNNENLDAVVEFSYFQREITGAVEADLDIMHSPNNDGNFERLGGQVFQVSNFIRRSNIDVLGTISVSPVSVAVLGYPSPFTEELNVDYVVEKDELVRFSLIDMAGRAVVRETLQARAGKNTYLINRPDLRAGIYFLHISSSDNEGYRKVVKVNP